MTVQHFRVNLATFMASVLHIYIYNNFSFFVSGEKCMDMHGFNHDHGTTKHYRLSGLSLIKEK